MSDILSSNELAEMLLKKIEDIKERIGEINPEVEKEEIFAIEAAIETLGECFNAVTEGLENKLKDKIIPLPGGKKILREVEITKKINKILVNMPIIKMDSKESIFTIGLLQSFKKEGYCLERIEKLQEEFMK